MFGSGKPQRDVPVPINPIRCPQCSSERPFFTMLDLRAYWYDGDGLHDAVAGHRVQCQECAHIFSLDSRGTFKHNRSCYPVEAAAPVSGPQPQGKDDEPDMDPHPIGIARQRPDV